MFEFIIRVIFHSMAASIVDKDNKDSGVIWYILGILFVPGIIAGVCMEHGFYGFMNLLIGVWILYIFIRMMRG